MIQGDTQSAVQAIAKIRAGEQQNATTDQISNNLREVAQDSSEIAQSISGVAENAQRTDTSSRELSQMSLGLQRRVGQFKITDARTERQLQPQPQPRSRAPELAHA